MILVKLKRYIDNSGLKKKKVAEQLGISVGHLSYVLNDKRELSIDLENKIRQLLA